MIETDYPRLLLLGHRCQRGLRRGTRQAVTEHYGVVWRLIELERAVFLFPFQVGLKLLLDHPQLVRWQTLVRRVFVVERPKAGLFFHFFGKRSHGISLPFAQPLLLRVQEAINAVANSLWVRVIRRIVLDVCMFGFGCHPSGYTSASAGCVGAGVCDSNCLNMRRKVVFKKKRERRWTINTRRQPLINTQHMDPLDRDSDTDGCRYWRTPSPDSEIIPYMQSEHGLFADDENENVSPGVAASPDFFGEGGVPVAVSPDQLEVQHAHQPVIPQAVDVMSVWPNQVPGGYFPGGVDQPQLMPRAEDAAAYYPEYFGNEQQQLNAVYEDPVISVSQPVVAAGKCVVDVMSVWPNQVPGGYFPGRTGDTASTTACYYSAYSGNGQQQLMTQPELNAATTTATTACYSEYNGNDTAIPALTMSASGSPRFAPRQASPVNVSTPPRPVRRRAARRQAPPVKVSTPSDTVRTVPLFGTGVERALRKLGAPGHNLYAAPKASKADK